MSLGSFVRKYNSVLSEEMLEDLMEMVREERRRQEDQTTRYPRGEGG